MFIAHDIAGWLGIPAGIVIVTMIILRRTGKALRARRKQARADQEPGQQMLAGPGAGQETGR
jgi:hypothetical protein